ncbi:MAG: hypothetical protein IJB96_01545 [Lachnospira sp.]|nr:hypothetical protein [Lachnospira sp.]
MIIFIIQIILGVVAYIVSSRIVGLSMLTSVCIGVTAADLVWVGVDISIQLSKVKQKMNENPYAMNKEEPYKSPVSKKNRILYMLISYAVTLVLIVLSIILAINDRTVWVAKLNKMLPLLLLAGAGIAYGISRLKKYIIRREFYGED